MGSAKELKQEHVEALGEELGRVYHELWQELARLYGKWNEFVELYGTKPSRVELLNKSAPNFFKIVQDGMWENILIHIARLTDKPKTLGKQNLTALNLSELVSSELKEQLIPIIEELKVNTNFCRDWRNRKYAHKDLDLALKTNAKPLKKASRDKVKLALESLAKVLNTVSYFYLNSTTSFHMKLGGSRGAADLLYFLDKGLRAEEERMERIKNGEYTAKDFHDRNI